MRVGFVGYRGMVGSVLMERMRAERDFDGLEPTFFSTSAAGSPAPEEAGGALVEHAHDLDALERCAVIVTTQGGEWTKQVHPALRGRGWTGRWIDASSALRVAPDSTLVLDPVNGPLLRDAIHAGARDLIGANCTVSVMLMGLIGLLRTGEVEWLTSMTYQAASGAGAAQMRELVAQMRAVGLTAGRLLDDPAASALEVERAVAAGALPTEALGAPLAGSALPWIDGPMRNGQTREEWKAEVEATRLLGFHLPMDGLCVRIGSLRSHAMALTIKLRRPVPLVELEASIAAAHPWVRLVPNEKEATLRHLTPAAVAGTLDVAVGRLRPMTLGPDVLTCFVVGDQLLWGAAEPLRRVLRMLRD